MNINLLPWRENKRIKYPVKIIKYAFLWTIFVLFFIFMSLYMRPLRFGKVEKANHLAELRFLEKQQGFDKRSKTLWISDFMNNLPVSVQGNLYVNKILFDGDVIRLSVCAGKVKEVETFIQNIKLHNKLKRIALDKAESHVGYNSNNISTFYLTLFLENEKSFSDHSLSVLPSKESNNDYDLLEKISEIANLLGVNVESAISNDSTVAHPLVRLKAQANYEQLTQFIVRLTDKLQKLFIGSLLLFPMEKERGGEVLEMQVNLGECS